MPLRWFSSRCARILASILLVAVLAIWATACKREPEDETFSRHTLMEWVRSDTSSGGAPASAASDDLVLYLDASASMQGFADRAGSFEYSCALRALVRLAEQRQ